MVCKPLDISLNLPTTPSGSPIKGFGIPFSLPLPNIPFPDGFPEDLLSLLDQLEMLIPPGALKPQLNPNFGKDIFDAIMKLLDQFMPFLMLYKFFLPVLNLIICIIEVLCSLMNPFKLIRALNRLFRQCIPQFLNLFPIFALIIMIISLLLLILALIEYILAQILKLIQALLRNINALNKAFQKNDANGVLAIARKIGTLLCVFQNLFVLFALFNIILQVIRDILSLLFAIPPCEDGNSGDANSCCTPDVCPAIVKNPYTNFTGILKYLPQANLETSLVLPPPLNTFTVNLRNESWQLYDLAQTQSQAFRNIFDAFDVVQTPKPIFFPTDATYTAQTDPNQAPYQIDLRLFYNPSNWGRTGSSRFIRFNNCIMTHVPSVNLQQGDNTNTSITTAVAILAGGLGFEDDNSTILTGFAIDGITAITSQATLENFIHSPAQNSISPTLSLNDGYTFSNIQYTFRPNIAPLLQKNIVTLGCTPDIAVNREFINNIFAGDVGLKTALLTGIVNGANFPDAGAAQQCMLTALAALRTNLTPAGVADFQTTTNICLQKLKDDTNGALQGLIGIGFDPCKSTFDLTPNLQFTTNPIVVAVHLNERNGLPLTNGLSTEIATNLASRIKSHMNFGDISQFVYDGYQAFNANLTSKMAGSGQISISFDDQIFCTNIIPDDPTIAPTHTLQSLTYRFIQSTVSGTIPVPPVGEGNASQGIAPDRDAGDIARDSVFDSKDGV